LLVGWNSKTGANNWQTPYFIVEPEFNNNPFNFRRYFCILFRQSQKDKHMVMDLDEDAGFETSVIPVIDPPRSPEIGGSVSSFVNVAFHQNAIPILSDLSIALDESADEIRGATLTLESDPPFVAKRSWVLDRLIPGNTVRVTDTDLNLDPGLLAGMTEAHLARVQLSLVHENVRVAERAFDTKLLAPDEWGGIASFPEILAAFVRPNDPAIEILLKKAADALHASGKQASLDGYTTGRRERAWEIASGIWSAVSSLDIDYAVPPASFETTGQKVRSPSHILEYGLATCLDLTLLFAAALEQAGLNPLVVLTQGHACVGVWLTKQDFSTAVVSDPLELRKRLQLGEMILFETTLAAQRVRHSFRSACERGATHVAESADEAFELAIDIRRARQKRILPLADLNATPPQQEPDAHTPGSPLFIDEAPDFGDFPEPPTPAGTDETPAARLERWKRRLLDLSLRNRLLNFKASSKSIPLVCPDPAALLRMIASGNDIKLLPKPDLMSGEDPRNQNIHLTRHGDDATKSFALEALNRGEVIADTPASDLDTRLLELYRTAHQHLEEGGANVLFLAVGFLRWTQQAKDSAKKAARAPLILIPVTLDRKSARSGFRFKSHDDEIRFNPTLLQMLKQDVGLNLPALEKDLHKPGEIVDVPAVWRIMRTAILEIPGWEVSEEIVLSTFSFTKYLMWKDLVDRTEDLKRSPIVQHLIETARRRRMRRRHVSSGSHRPRPRSSARDDSDRTRLEHRAHLVDGLVDQSRRDAG
jgi:hypothetical protein